MKKILLIFIAVSFVGACFTACGDKVVPFKEKQEVKLLSFDPQDSVQVDQLLRFYMQNDILPQEALACKHDTLHGLHTFDCLSEECFITNDFIDSASCTFFVEVDFDSGSSGNNGIYICQRTEEGFKILFSTEGSINQELRPESIVNGYKVLYVQSQDHTSRVFYDGKKFVREDLPEEENLAQK